MNKSHPDWKGKNKIVPICREQKTLAALTSEFSKATGCKADSQKSTAGN